MNIKVGVRVRPFNFKEQQMQSKLCVDMVDNKTYLFSSDLSQKPREFIFDYSFWSHDQFIVKQNGQLLAQTEKYADQKHVFKQLGGQIVDNSWKGYNCCLMAYGQKKSGKSYSMFGEGSNKGIVSLFNEEIFDLIAKNKENRECSVQISMFEVYDQKVRDLIPVKQDNEYLKIKQNEAQGVYVKGLSKHQVHNAQETHKLISEGFRNKVIQATKMSLQTSRSNIFINIYLKQIYKQPKLQKEQQQQIQKQRMSLIQFVDLADSTRIGKPGLEIYKDISHVDKGITTLAVVIGALRAKAAGKNKFVPYRDSNVTRLLKNSLGGSCHNYMLCCIGPSFNNYDETLSTLRFADRVRGISNNAVTSGKGVEEYEKTEKKQKQYIEQTAKKQQQQIS